MTYFDLKVTDKLLSTTRSVRKRLDFEREVPLEIVMDCLELCLQAPTGSNRQGWRWLVVRDEGVRRELGRLYRKGAGDYLEQGMAQARESGSAQNERVFDSAMYLAENIERAPVHVIPCIENFLPKTRRGSCGRAFWGRSYRRCGVFSWRCAHAVWVRWYTTLHLRCEAEAAELLGVPDDFMQVALIPVAYTIGTNFKPATRRPLDEIVHMNTWG